MQQIEASPTASIEPITKPDWHTRQYGTLLSAVRLGDFHTAEVALYNLSLCYGAYGATMFHLRAIRTIMEQKSMSPTLDQLEVESEEESALDKQDIA